MLFRSNINEDVKSSQDLIVLCYVQERVLVPLPKTYEDAQQRARDVFNLAGDVVFETKGLQGAEDTPVRIHSTAWEGISPVLHSVEVISTDAPRHEPAHSDVASGVRHGVSAQKRVPGPSAYSNRVASVGAKSPLQVAERQSASARKTPVVVSRSRSDTSTSGSTSIAGKEPKASSSKAVMSPPKALAMPRPPLPKAAAPAPAKPQSPVKPPAYAQKAPKWTDEDEEEEEIRIPSPTKKRVNRPRVLSDYGLEEPEGQSEEEAHKPAALEEEEEEEEYDELEDAEYISAAPPAMKTPASSQGRAAPPAKSGSSSRSGVVQLDAMPSASHVPEREPSPKVKVEKGLAKPAVPSQETAPSQSQSQVKSDENFLIMIEYGDDPESRSLFKTRGRHMVSKVLMQACRTFGLEEYYNSARLVLLVEVEGDVEGETTVYRSVCNRKDTMAQAGAEPNARFVVEIADGEESACKPSPNRRSIRDTHVPSQRAGKRRQFSRTLSPVLERGCSFRRTHFFTICFNDLRYNDYCS